MNQERQRIAVIGAGVSGLTAAWLLADKHDVHLFEAGDYAGGHTNTEQVEAGGRTWPVNTGFIVFNDWTYPNFIKLMDRLGVASEVSNMSFSVDCHASGLQYNGTSLNTLFAQRRNLFNLNFLKMIREILRFNKETRADLAAGTIPDGETLGEYLNRNGYSRYFRNYYIVPMGAAIWSAPEIVLEQFPIRFFLQFFNNHGMLSVDDRPTWRVISGGSATYVNRMMDKLGERTHLNSPVTSVKRDEEGVTLVANGQEHRFDQVIFGCHSDQALAMLDDATDDERSILGAIAYQKNDVVLHTDASVLPSNRLAWAAWNYMIPEHSTQPVSVTYNMNVLQNFDDAPETFCVTLNRSRDINPEKVIKRFEYDHPVFTLDAVAAQERYDDIGNRNRTHFCGAYWFNGFHEDGVRSALRVTRAFGVEL
ncbi:NAD(P)/FAD-dependent oxidoreductase [Marinobacter nauticus]|uniref:NAD/FAD-binding protein n=3 Tax=Marinobacter TaxID=2742 RepID=A0A368V1H1_MARNT|nr:FAD-dependent oxidoreductase [Marinobacter nauticus]MEC9388056.1 FAD-dependent oxidoreductase [Pseudomonadota bacterium]RBP71822.1 putative NAD/FAD-binding protein [Marinobacter nauticus]RCW32841.1 putative NAD/FAD-binding protein [Marinobacter nauticus]TPW25598.1 FAD-dependent oxidoreductase [Marinobacter nauticus]CCG95263.1 putative dehydrogenase, with Flavin-containing amine oxidase [Marinobacter nauticus ATCC 49840]